MFDQQPIEVPVMPRRRRANARHLSLLRVGVLVVAGRRELCLVRNVSAGGMMVRVYSHVAEGERLTVELRHGEPLDGVARWSENGCIGVHFDAPVDVIRLISTSLEGPRPRMPRIAVDRAAWVREKHGSRMPARVANISQGGVRVAIVGQLPVGAHVVVSIEGLSSQHAVVRWRDDDVYGLTFNRVIALPELVHWLKLDEIPASDRTA